jgi:diaminopimelate decarboxylase
MTAPVRAGRLPYSWLRDIDLAPIVEQVGTPVFIYSEEQLLRNIARIQDAAKRAGLDGRVELYIPFFPNSNPHLMRSLGSTGTGLLLQLPSEHRILSRYGYDKFIVSPGHVSNDEIAFWARAGYPTFLSSLDEVSSWLETGDAPVSVRIDSLDSGKPGIKLSELGVLADLLDRGGRALECFEVYFGSGNSRAEMVGAIRTLFRIFKDHFPTARSINFAGGQGFVYDEWQESDKHFDWDEYLMAIRQTADEMGIPETVGFLFEPARDVLADTGALLMSVERDVITNPIGSLVVTDGSRMLMPSAQLRDRRHHVVFLDASLKEIYSPENSAGVHAALRGRSILRHDYILPGEYWVPEGVCAQCYLLIMDVGAYCATQHMEFLNIPPAAEVLVDAAGAAYLISERGDDLDKWRHLPAERVALTR